MFEQFALIDFVKRNESLGGLDYFYSEIIAPEMVLAGEYLKDIISEDGTVLWVNRATQI